MKHNISIAVAALALVCGGCNARPGSNAEKVTIAGCVQSAEQGLGAPNDKTDIDKFMLTNASFASSGAAPVAPVPNAAAPAPAPGEPVPAPAPNAPAPSDQAAAPAPAPTGTMYILDGKKSELREHLNQQVEVTGRLDRADARNASAPADQRAELHVDSVRMIAATCNR